MALEGRFFFFKDIGRSRMYNFQFCKDFVVQRLSL